MKNAMFMIFLSVLAGCGGGNNPPANTQIILAPAMPVITDQSPVTGH